MGLLVGLPLKLFHLLFVLIRLAWPILLLWALMYFLRRRQQRNSTETNSDPHFQGPVYTVDYEEVEPDSESGSDTE